MSDEIRQRDEEIKNLDKEVRKTIDRIYNAIDKNKGIRLSAKELQYLSVTLFADGPEISEGD